MGLFTRTTEKKDSKGIIGGFAAMIGFGIAATQLTRMTGVDVSKDELKNVAENWTAVTTNAPAWGALIASAVGLWGNWVRQFRVGRGGKNPLKSKGIMGNAAAVAAGVWAFSEAVHGDQEQITQIFGAAQEQWKIVAPAVLGILGALQGFWGRWRARSAI